MKKIGYLVFVLILLSSCGSGESQFMYEFCNCSNNLANVLKDPKYTGPLKIMKKKRDNTFYIKDESKKHKITEQQEKKYIKFRDNVLARPYEQFNNCLQQVRVKYTERGDKELEKIEAMEQVARDKYLGEQCENLKICMDVVYPPSNPKK